MTDPTSRALQVLGLLQSRTLWTAGELAERLAVTTRTVRRDVERLRGLGYTIEADHGPGGGYALGRGQILPPLLLDDDEAMAATLALTAAATSGDGINAEAALRARNKLDEVMPSALRRRVRGMRDSMGFLEVPSSLPVIDASVLVVCAQAVDHRVRLRFTYRDRHGETTRRVVEPHRLTAKGRIWWLSAYDRDRDGWRNFRVDRVSEPESTTWRFDVRSGLDEMLARLDEPISPSIWRHQAVVHLHAPYEEVRAAMPRAAGQLSPVDAQTTEFCVGGDDPDEAARWLTRLGYDFTVLGEGEIRAALARLAARLMSAVRT